jgi:hypothetical protein
LPLIGLVTIRSRARHAALDVPVSTLPSSVLQHPKVPQTAAAAMVR